MAATITGLDVVNKLDVSQASLSSISWAWFDEAIGILNAPTDKGSTELTSAGGVMDLSMPNSTLLSGEWGTLALYDPTGTKVGGYLLQVD